MGDHSVRYLGIVNSRRAIYVLFRLRNLLVRTLEFSVESAGKLCIPRLSPINTSISSPNAPSLQQSRLPRLYLRERRLTKPVYDQRTATLTLQTSQKVSTPLPFHAPKISSTLVLYLAQRSIDAHGRVLGPSEDTAPLAMGVRTRLYVSEIETLVRPGELLKLFVPFLAEGVDAVVRACFTFWLLVVGCVLVPLAGLLPEAVVRNGDVLADKDQ